jgi:sensor c-di-GMP phosphodiesterase-like protein
VIAEGVETEEQLAILRRLECDEVQGYLISRALPADEFVRFLRRPTFQTQSIDSKDEKASGGPISTETQVTL